MSYKIKNISVLFIRISHILSTAMNAEMVFGPEMSVFEPGGCQRNASQQTESECVQRFLEEAAQSPYMVLVLCPEVWRRSMGDMKGRA